MRCDEFDVSRLVECLISETGNPMDEDIAEIAAIYESTAKNSGEGVYDLLTNSRREYAFVIEAIIHLGNCPRDSVNFESYLLSIPEEDRKLAYRGKDKFEKHIRNLGF